MTLAIYARLWEEASEVRKSEDEQVIRQPKCWLESVVAVVGDVKGTFIKHIIIIQIDEVIVRSTNCSELCELSGYIYWRRDISSLALRGSCQWRCLL